MFLLGRREPLHPRLDAREMTNLFPTMLNMVDTILPVVTPDRIAELTGDNYEPDHDPGYEIDDDNDGDEQDGAMFGTADDDDFEDGFGGDGGDESDESVDDSGGESGRVA